MARPVHSSFHFEGLEPRAMMAAPYATFVSAVANATALFVTIDYHADAGLDTSTLGAGDIQLTSSRPTLNSNLFGSPATLPNGDTQVTYLVNAFAGAWDYTHTGTYTVVSPAGQVKDLNGQNLQFNNIAQLWLWFSAPRAVVTGTTVEPNDWLISINYSDDTGVNQQSIDGNDITVEGPGLFPGITRQSLTVNSATNMTAVYRVPAPQGGWKYTDTGTYVIRMNSGQVTDTASPANTIPQFPLASYWLWFDRPAAEIQTYTIDTTQWLIPIKYSGRDAITASSMTTGDITVSAPNGYSATGSLAGLINNNDGTFTATYRVGARGGDWDWTDNESYVVTMVDNRVRDNSGRTVPGGVLNIYGLWWNNPAAAVVLPTTPTLHQWDFSVDFSDNGALDSSSITANAVRVEAPDGTKAVSLVSTTTNNGVIRATFRLVSAGGLANGAYQIWTNPNQVHDTQNNYVLEGSRASFWFWF